MATLCFFQECTIFSSDLWYTAESPNPLRYWSLATLPTAVHKKSTTRISPFTNGDAPLLQNYSPQRAKSICVWESALQAGQVGCPEPFWKLQEPLPKPHRLPGQPETPRCHCLRRRGAHPFLAMASPGLVAERGEVLVVASPSLCPRKGERNLLNHRYPPPPTQDRKDQTVTQRNKCHLRVKLLRCST